MPARENSGTKRTLDKLNAIPGVVARKNWGGVYGGAGEPDITGCARGRFFAIERKVNGNVATPLQAQRLRKYQEAGALVGIAYDWEDIIRIIAPALEGRYHETRASEYAHGAGSSE